MVGPDATASGQELPAVTDELKMGQYFFLLEHFDFFLLLHHTAAVLLLVREVLELELATN